MIAHIWLLTYDSTHYLLDSLFDESLKAELKRQPHLDGLHKNKKDLEEPGVLFRGRLKGYFVAPKLCRVWVLMAFTASHDRGEYFVKWTDLADNTSHDGTHVFAHFMTIKYISLHQPGMSVQFNSDGSLRTTSVHFRKLRDYIWAYRSQLARRCHDMLKQVYHKLITYDCSHMIVHTWLLTYDCSHMIVHIWLITYDCSHKTGLCNQQVRTEGLGTSAIMVVRQPRRNWRPPWASESVQQNWHRISHSRGKMFMDSRTGGEPPLGCRGTAAARIFWCFNNEKGDV